MQIYIKKHRLKKVKVFFSYFCFSISSSTNKTIQLISCEESPHALSAEYILKPVLDGANTL